MGDPLMTEYLGGPEGAEKIRDRHQRYCRLSDSGADRMFVIVVGSDQLPVGSVGYWEKEWQGKTVWETGWSVLREYQGRGIATQALAAAVTEARAAQSHRFLHAFPSEANAASNAVCRKAGFTLQSQVDFEYPPGHLMRCNDWRLDLLAIEIVESPGNLS
jgi:RimJ/RimL family protein N-acetyltransferase